MSFNSKNEKYHLKNDKKWSCKLISFNLKNEKCLLKNDKKWSCIPDLRFSYEDIIKCTFFLLLLISEYVQKSKSVVR